MDTICTYNDTRDEVLVAYLYNDIDPAERAAFDAHLVVCSLCRQELDELSMVRGQLAEWTPPETASRAVRFEMFAGPEKPRPVRLWQRLGDMPVWAQAAAAALIFGVSAAIANVNITYDNGGLTVRTGWMKPAAPPAPPPVVNREPADPAPWRTDLSALEQQLRTEMRTAAVRAPVPPEASQDAMLRRVRTLVEESEQRQQRELALRIAEVDGHVQAQRLSDLRNIERNLTTIQSNTGVDMRRLYRMTNDLAVRVSQSR